MEEGARRREPASTGGERWSRASRLAALGAILVAATLVCARDFGRGEPHYDRDEGSHALTGLFVRDLVADLPIDAPEDHAWRWYARYPALGLLIRPPLFQAALGAAFALLGPSLAAGQVVTLAFLHVLLAAWFHHADRTFGTAVAVVATLLLLGSPTLSPLARALMLEVPSLALCALAWALFGTYLDDGRARFVLAAGVAAGAALLTKAHAAFIVLAFLSRSQPPDAGTSRAARRRGRAWRWPRRSRVPTTRSPSP